jgi:hypothetical protein
VYKVTGLLTLGPVFTSLDEAWPGIEIIPAALADRENVINEQLVVGIIMDKIDFAAIDHQQGALVIVMKKFGISGDQVGEVTFLNQLF